MSGITNNDTECRKGREAYSADYVNGSIKARLSNERRYVLTCPTTVVNCYNYTEICVKKPWGDWGYLIFLCYNIICIMMY